MPGVGERGTAEGVGAEPTRSSTLHADTTLPRLSTVFMTLLFEDQPEARGSLVRGAAETAREIARRSRTSRASWSIASQMYVGRESALDNVWFRNGACHCATASSPSRSRRRSPPGTRRNLPGTPTGMGTRRLDCSLEVRPAPSHRASAELLQRFAAERSCASRSAHTGSGDAPESSAREKAAQSTTSQARGPCRPS